MDNQTGKPFDPYNLSEIEKIQFDIERDLEIEFDDTSKQAQPDAEHAADSWDGQWFCETTAEADSAADVFNQNIDRSTDSFYSESIKEAADVPVTRTRRFGRFAVRRVQRVSGYELHPVAVAVCRIPPLDFRAPPAIRSCF